MLPLKAMIFSAAKASSKAIVKHSPAICAGFAIAGVVGTAVCAFKASSKAQEIVNRKHRDLEDVPPADKSLRRQIRLEMVKELAPVMAPTVISGIVTVALIICSHSLNVKKQAALSAAYSGLVTSFKEYKEKAKEIVGAKKAASIQEAADAEHMKSYPMDGAKMVLTGDGEYVFFDKPSGRYFKSDIEKIRYKINTLNARLISEMWISKNDLYYELGLEPVSDGDEYGWNLNGPDGLISIDTTWLSDEMNRPYCVLSYLCEKRMRFGDF